MRQQVTLEKYHALGNDYLVYDPRRNAQNGARDILLAGAGGKETAGGASNGAWAGPDAPPLDIDAVRLICDRNFGCGSDGILYGPVDAGGGRIGVRIYNPDGGEAEKSGSGVRIFSKYLKDFGYVHDRSFTLATLGGDVTVDYLSEDGALMKVMMGKVTFRSGEIPVAGADREVVDEPMTFGGKDYRVTCVSIGNPHCVIPVGALSKDEAVETGRIAESAPCFPNRINVQFMKVLDRRNIQIEIYERGAGYTLASGTSSCAAASAAHRLGLVDGSLTVHMPGGALEIEIGADWTVRMTGTVSRVGTFAPAAEFAERLTAGR
ncbi:MAG: diaminopimelate epimerase [Clostridiales bacterium]|jgi:diaminopimelate epimerase|nr:diaminopimelate epimerase [Clostridiales bacterium]